MVIPQLIPKSVKVAHEPRRQCHQKRVQTRKGLRYCSVVLAGNGRSNPNTVMVDGKPELHREGAYYLEWREGLRPAICLLDSR